MFHPNGGYEAFEKRVYGKSYKPDPTALLRELSPEQRQRLVVEFGLQASGQPRVIGKGTKAVAFASDRPDIVIKLTTDVEDAWASTKIMTDGAPFYDVLARIYFVAQVNDFVWVVIAERLQPIFDSTLLSQLNHDHVFNEYAWKHAHRKDTPTLFALTRLQEASDALGLNLVMDAHPGNWGLRDGPDWTPFGKLVYFDFGSTQPAEKPMIKKLNPSSDSVMAGDGILVRLTPKFKRAMKRRFKVDLDKDLFACGSTACAWLPGRGRGKPGKQIIKITTDKHDAYAAEIIMRLGGSFSDVLANVYGVWRIDGATPSSPYSPYYYVVATEYVAPVVRRKTSMDYNETSQTYGADEIMDTVSGADRSNLYLAQIFAAKVARVRQAQELLGLNLLSDAHAGNWGLRVPGDLRSAVLFDYGFSAASMAAVLPTLKANPTRR